MERDAARSQRQIPDRTHAAGFGDLVAAVDGCAVGVGKGGRRNSQSQRECVQSCESSQYHLLRLRWTAATLEKLKPRSKHLYSRRRRCYLSFDFVERCTGGLEIGLSRWNTGQCAFVRLKRGCHGGLSGGKSLASFSGHQMLSSLLPCIGRNRFDGLPSGNCTS
ncbi:hypothetical protein IVB25_11580 [Bradyrhizobium sp. 193]|uniref:hypothetical protein n=1 Tax=Bradyrhizobium sp. 193 TaxID=2782661 RepID=UPI001FFA97BA|nr:hypothetical protein [Bradyrhizobium sp. 193]MCK1483347.1 hypothetical protein [Bradyrhizobium sp. 193]